MSAPDLSCRFNELKLTLEVICVHQSSTQEWRCSRVPLLRSRSTKLLPPCLVWPFCFPDGLVDCMDPDCCIQIACQGQTYCRGSPDPAAIASQGQSSAAQPTSKGFYDRVSFLIGPSGSHVIPWDNTFNSR